MHARFVALPALGALAALLACGPAPTDAPEVATAAVDGAAVDPGNAGGNKAVTVVDWNLYVGTDVSALLGASSTEELLALAAEAWVSVQLTDFDERAEAIADRIAAARPVAIGVQEAALWRTEFPPDAYLGAPPDAEDVAYDFLAILQAALAARGLHYDLAAVVENADLELSVPVSLEPLQLLDVRVTDRDAVLVRRDAPWSNPLAASFATTVPVIIGDPAAPIVAFDYLRGWASVDVKYRGETFRVLSTHLEAFHPGVRLAQAGELAAIVAASPLPVIAVGDFNSQPGQPAYEALAAVLSDAWTAVHPGEPGYTCCSNDPLLRDTSAPPWDERIDLVLYTPPFVPLAASVIGEETPGDLTATGMWPSDHAGVVATLRYVEPRFYALTP